MKKLISKRKYKKMLNCFYRKNYCVPSISERQITLSFDLFYNKNYRRTREYFDACKVKR